MVRQGPCPGPASSSSPSGWPAARASLFRAPHTEVTFSDTQASPSRWSGVFAACSRGRRRGRKRRALVGRRHEARRSRLFCGPQALRARGLVAFRLRPASRPLPVWVGLAALGRKASSLVVRASRRRPLCPHACGVNKEAEASRGTWSVVLVVALVLRAPASPSARARLGPRPRGAWWASAFLS